MRHKATTAAAVVEMILAMAMVTTMKTMIAMTVATTAIIMYEHDILAVAKAQFCCKQAEVIRP